MTNNEAIKYLMEAQRHIDLKMGGYTQDVYDAIDVAIVKLCESLEDTLYEAILKFLKDYTIVDLLGVLKDAIEKYENERRRNNGSIS